MARVSNYTDVLYHREYSNDVPPQTDLVKRVALAAVPFLGLHAPLRMPISVVMGGLRVWNVDRKDILSTLHAVVALVASFFPMGQIVTTLQDIALEIDRIRKCESQEETAKSLLKIVNHLIYLALISRGGLELSIIALAIQCLTNLVQSMDEFKNGRWIEGVANLAMAGVRLGQMQRQYVQLKRNQEIEALVRRVYVGKLGKKWQFPSDHLPVGIKAKGVRIISWNVMNTAYIGWVIDKDGQGLNGSMLSELNVTVDKSGLTVRDIVVAQKVANMTSHADVIALQECGAPFLSYLKDKLPAEWGMVRSFAGEKKDQGLVLYNKSHLTYLPTLSETAEGAFPSDPERPLQKASFGQQNGPAMQIINGHIPGDPAKPGREEFARYVYKNQREGAVTVALGDNNFERDEMIDAYRKAGFTDFRLHSPWKTNIDPYTKESKAIDHLFVIGSDDSRDLTSDEILSGKNLQDTIDLLSTNI